VKCFKLLPNYPPRFNNKRYSVLFFLRNNLYRKLPDIIYSAFSHFQSRDFPLRISSGKIVLEQQELGRCHFYPFLKYWFSVLHRSLSKHWADYGFTCSLYFLKFLSRSNEKYEMRKTLGISVSVLLYHWLSKFHIKKTVMRKRHGRTNSKIISQIFLRYISGKQFRNVASNYNPELSITNNYEQWETFVDKRSKFYFD
jgi:hypothetical protein